jgi:hypothetical protein
LAMTVKAENVKAILIWTKQRGGKSVPSPTTKKFKWQIETSLGKDKNENNHKNPLVPFPFSGTQWKVKRVHAGHLVGEAHQALASQGLSLEL